MSDYYFTIVLSALKSCWKSADIIHLSKMIHWKCSVSLLFTYQ